ncbi:hypothetical protein SAMN05660297_02259 [Natronincola peptidivorans]|uniref:Uncharacterized protein n=1 Tax=Natronincola peptidivorans TaxID=426128 RepID=A0A1I0E0T9_9FIRM|nr:hypothetical protein [Natronincola peptidivorans]SET38645.1 hypothetical protein SAMN05660297_02259 [Natronincola peptidivorans]
MNKTKVKKITKDPNLETIVTEKRGWKRYEHSDYRTKLIDGIYQVYPVGYYSDVSVIICCPHCKQFHLHANHDGLRMSHCNGHRYGLPERSYYITGTGNKTED